MKKEEKEKIRAWRQMLCAQLDAADKMLAQLRPGDGLFICEHDKGYSGDLLLYGTRETLFRVTRVERAHNSAFHMRRVKPIGGKAPNLPVLEASKLCTRFDPSEGTKPPLMRFDTQQQGEPPISLVRYESYTDADYRFKNRPIPRLTLGILLAGLDNTSETFADLEALQGVVARHIRCHVIARVRPGEVRVLLSDTPLK